MNILLNANALHIPLASESVQCVITSPPYYGLRDYGTAKWEGGSVECDHKGPVKNTQAGFNERYTGKPPKETDKQSELTIPYKDVCGKCGAIRADAQIGLERTPQEYVDGLVSVFREVWRVLRDDGVVWLNLGDSYASGEVGRHDKIASTHLVIGEEKHNGRKRQQIKLNTGLKPKDLLMIPARVALALQADGWYLRSDIIWHKPNPMPESVTDRPTKAHEYVFLLSKSERYFYDAEAIAEPIAQSTANDNRLYDEDYDVGRPERGYTGQPQRGSGLLKPNRSKTFARDGAVSKHVIPGQSAAQHRSDRTDFVQGFTRNRRTVWTVAPSPYSGAHFATFPPKLVEPMVLAGSAKGDLVLDPFAGTATVGRVAIQHQRRFVGLELNPAYIELAQDRTSNVEVRMF